MMRKRMAALALSALALVAPGCATGGASAGGMDEMGMEARDDRVMVIVENNLAIPTAMTVYLYPENGNRQALGTIGPNRTEVLSFGAANLVGTARLVAMAPGGAQIASNTFILRNGEELRWDLQSNIVR